MDHIEISYRLRRAGSSQTAIARDLGVTRGAVNNTIVQARTSRKIATAIAAKLGLDVSEIWPGRYDEPRRARRTTATRKARRTTATRKARRSAR